jgi:deoxyribose-phosphate aldolase
MRIEKYFDHTLLRADAAKKEIERLCQEAMKHDFASVCVNLYRTAYAKELLKGSDVRVCTVVGFPLGAVNTSVKVFETKEAVRAGADEIDMVLNIGALKDREYDYVLKEIEEVKNACQRDRMLKVIIETCLLTEEEKKTACELAVKAGADFVKTSTGFGRLGAVVEDVKLMKKTVNGRARVKAAGGIRDAGTAKVMIEAGADRLGTSATVNIVQNWEAEL